GALITVGRNIFDAGPAATPSDAAGAAASITPLEAIMLQGGFFNLTPTNNVFVIYPLLPWLGILMLGYALGKLYTDYDSETRQKLLLRIGLGAIALFVILRLINVYGDPAPWSTQKNWMFTIMSFVNTTKYPISLLFALMTLGPILILLSVLEKVKIP